MAGNYSSRKQGIVNRQRRQRAFNTALCYRRGVVIEKVVSTGAMCVMTPIRQESAIRVQDDP